MTYAYVLHVILEVENAPQSIFGVAFHLVILFIQHTQDALLPIMTFKTPHTYLDCDIIFPFYLKAMHIDNNLVSSFTHENTRIYVITQKSNKTSVFSSTLII